MDKNLQMSLKTKWFEMTKAGIKTEDYRELNYYWFKRLVGNADKLFSMLIGYYPRDCSLDYKNKCVIEIVKSEYFANKYLINFTHNTITLGYPKSGDNERIIQYEHKGIEIRTGNPEWGAEPNKLYFVIKHGDIINN